MQTLDSSDRRSVLAELLQKQTGQKSKSENSDRSNSFAQQRLPLLNEKWDNLRANGDYFYHAVIEEYDGSWVVVNGKRMLMLASYSYLGLMGHPEINTAACAAIQQFGTGTYGARLVAGTTKLHKELEATIARFKKTEDAIVFNSGYVTNLATISTLLGKGDVVISDQFNHASIADGCAFSGAEIMTFKHNDMASLEECLKRAGNVGKLVVADAVFSMSGAIINLPEVVRLCREYGAYLMIDEAHSVGVLGDTGRGIEEYFGMPSDSIDVKMGTLSKTIPSNGGYIAGKAELVKALRDNARGLTFSGSLSPVQIAAANAGFGVIEREPERLQKLHQNLERYSEGLRSLGLNSLNSKTPIIPIICPNNEVTLKMTHLCWEEGLFLIPAFYPIVPVASPRLRTNITAAHSNDDIDFVLNALERAGKQSGLIK